jgi:hypothetical protein
LEAELKAALMKMKALVSAKADKREIESLFFCSDPDEAELKTILSGEDALAAVWDLLHHHRYD